MDRSSCDLWVTCFAAASVVRLPLTDNHVFLLLFSFLIFFCEFILSSLLLFNLLANCIAKFFCDWYCFSVFVGFFSSTIENKKKIPCS